MALRILVQLSTFVAAVIGLYFGKDKNLVHLAAAAAGVTTIFSIMLLVRSERDSSFTKNALTNLIRAIQPGEYVREAIKSRISQAAGALGLPDMVVKQFGSRLVFEFRKLESDKRCGLLVLTPKDLSELSLVDQMHLAGAIKNQVLASWGTDDLSKDWNTIADRIYDIAHVIFASSLDRPFHFNGWARVDKKYLAASIREFGNDQATENRAEFPESTLQSLLAKSVLERSAEIATICESYVQRMEDRPTPS